MYMCYEELWLYIVYSFSSIEIFMIKTLAFLYSVYVQY